MNYFKYIIVVVVVVVVVVIIIIIIIIVQAREPVEVFLFTTVSSGVHPDSSGAVSLGIKCPVREAHH